MTKRHNGVAAPVHQAEQMQRVLEGLLGVLQYLDLERFRIITEQPEDTPNAVLLEAMHRTRIAHPGINRVQKAASKRWLEENGT